jgi:recombination protein RecT
MLQAAQWGLELDPVLGLAYLVPYKTTATLIPGYQGLMELARRSGKVLSFDVAGVHEADTFKYRRGLNKSLTHIPALTARGKLIAVYAIAYLTHETYQIPASGAHPRALTEFEVMNLEEVDAIRERSRAGRGGPWVTDYEAMAKKTVVRRLCKILPRTPELARALHIDEEADRGDDQTLDIPVINLPDDEDESTAPGLPAPAEDPLMAMMRDKAAKASRPVAVVRDDDQGA